MYLLPNKTIKIIVAAFVISIVASCTKKVGTPEEIIVPAEVDTGCKTSYETRIKPIIQTKCSIKGCHVEGSRQGDLRQYAVLSEKITSGKFKTYVFELKIMPPASAAKLTEAEIQELNCWINEGALEN